MSLEYIKKNLRIIFIHHSTGRRLIKQGRVRELFEQKNKVAGTKHEFWDHDYNKLGLTDPSGNATSISFFIPDDNTDPDGLEVLFTQPVKNPPNNALSHILSFDVVIFKSCYPVCAIQTDAQLDSYKNHYLTIRETIRNCPRILFIAMTPPPLLPVPFPGFPGAVTVPEAAKRARLFSRWLLSENFLNNVPNLVGFDFFDALAAPDGNSKQANMLRSEYRSLMGLDAHPNKQANKTIAPLFVDFVWVSIQNYFEL